MQYELHIGEEYNVEQNKSVPKYVMTITEEQLGIIERFATVEKDADLKSVYILNKCRFTVHPIMDEVV